MIGQCKIGQRVSVKRGLHKGKSGKVVDLLPGACKVRLGRKSVWLFWTSVKLARKNKS
jgi:hypothetical protein